ncbi:autophagy-related protein 22-like protein [Pelagophyceae sp. CCMP2097]|nr:autophagy-related protein 22-like protein [Pelagophyceae sp. CCMP2097]
MLWDNAASGLVLASNLFLAVAMLRLLTQHAGCDDDDGGVCRKGTFLGLRPSSFVTFVVMVGQLSAAVAMPFVGACVDYTGSRRRLGAASGWVMCGVTLAQAAVSREALLAVSLLQIISIASYITHQCSSLSYLPGLSRDEVTHADDARERHRVNTGHIVATLVAHLFAIIVVFALALGLDWNDVEMARYCQAGVGVSLAVIFLRVWHAEGGYEGRLVDVPATKSRPPHLQHSSLLKVGYYELRHSWANMARNGDTRARDFIIGTSLSSASMASFTTLAVVYLHDHLALSAQQTVAAVFITLATSVPAGMAFLPIMDRFGAFKAFFGVVVFMAVVTFVAQITLCGPGCAGHLFLYSALWGFGFGGYYASNTALFVTLVPPDAEAQYMSVYYFAAQILSWLPVACYTLLNEVADQQPALFIIAFFLLASLPFHRRVGRDPPVPARDAPEKSLRENA